MLPPSNDPCIIFSLKNVCLSSKYAIFIFIRDLCPKLDTQPAGQNNARQGSRHLDNLSDRCRRAAAAGVIYGYVSVWLFCDIVPAGQPDAAMKMCLSVIRLFNLSGGTGLSVSLTLANPPDLGSAHTLKPHYMCASPKYFPSQTKYFSSLSRLGDHRWGSLANLSIGGRLEEGPR